MLIEEKFIYFMLKTKT